MNASAVRTLCFVSARNLGDAVIHADFVKALVAAGYAERYIVWTFPEAAFLFEDIASCSIVVSTFPMGATARRFIRGRVGSFWSAVHRIRRERPTETLELISDFRERWVCRLLGARRNLSPGWHPDHPFRRHSRMGRFRPSSLVDIPAAVTSLYAAYDLVLSALIGPGRPSFTTVPDWPCLRPSAPSEGGRLRIGLHPFASVPCKLWPQQHWLSLIEQLRNRYPQVGFVLFGAPSDRAGLAPLARHAGDDTEVCTTSLRGFRSRLHDLDLLVGLDSFSVHLAHSQGVPVVILVGPNDPRLFTPPGAKAVTRPGECAYQPCGGKPRCIGTSFQYVCMRAIAPADVLGAIASGATA